MIEYTMKSTDFIVNGLIRADGSDICFPRRFQFLLLFGPLIHKKKKKMKSIDTYT